MPRRYRSGRREAAVQKTRRRILEATMRLHGEQGIIGTSWEDIARRSGVSLATVYRHFRSLNELVPACGAMAEEHMRPPLPEHAETLFAGAVSPADRVERLVDDLCGFYERAGGALLLAKREGHLVEPLGAWSAGMDRTRRHLVRAALGPEAGKRAESVVDALVSFPVWQALLEAGVSRGEARRVIRRLAAGAGVRPSDEEER